jgi:hypothetical protein
MAPNTKCGRRKGKRKFWVNEECKTRDRGLIGSLSFFNLYEYMMNPTIDQYGASLRRALAALRRVALLCC